MPRVIPWTESLNWNLQVGDGEEIYILFHEYVCPERTREQETRVCFPQFVQLPTELQIRIIHFCSSATLFQLMHVSSSTRSEAIKLFWSDAGSRYVVPGHWLHAGGLSGYTHHAVAAFAHMKHVEVDFGAGRVFEDHPWDPPGRFARRPAADVAERLADEFWQTFQRHLPCATNVVLKRFEYIKAGESAPADLTTLAERCPAKIRASVSCMERVVGLRCRISLWEHVRNNDNQLAIWQLVDHDTAQLILPPTKTFHGPVGAFYRYNYHLVRIGYLYDARRILLNQAIEAYFTHNPQVPFVCPALECDFRFRTPQEWALHACEVSHLGELKPPTEALDVLFSEHAERIERTKREDGVMLTEMIMEWGEKGSEQRKEAEEAFLHQLEHDPEYAHKEPARETEVWREYQIEMNEEETVYTQRNH